MSDSGHRPESRYQGDELPRGHRLGETLDNEPEWVIAVECGHPPAKGGEVYHGTCPGFVRSLDWVDSDHVRCHHELRKDVGFPRSPRVSGVLLLFGGGPPRPLEQVP